MVFLTGILSIEVRRIDPADVTRYVRPEDIPLLDRSILEPIVDKVAREMAQAYPEQSVNEWIEDLQLALLKGEVLIVIDDRRRRIGLVRADRPPFLGLVSTPTGAGGAVPIGMGDPDDPLGIKRWENDKASPGTHQEKGEGGGSF